MRMVSSVSGSTSWNTFILGHAKQGLNGGVLKLILSKTGTRFCILEQHGCWSCGYCLVHTNYILFHDDAHERA
jgi:hypothetical protein